MGSVNRDFVFAELQAGEQTHNSHLDMHTVIHMGRGSALRTVQAKHRRHACTCKRSMHTLTYTLNKLNAIWKTVVRM